jgi:hypothetical protein
MRFHSHDLLLNPALSVKMRRIIRATTYWESFPDSYTEAQVEAAKNLLVVLARYTLAEVADTGARKPELVSALLRVWREMDDK